MIMKRQQEMRFAGATICKLQHNNILLAQCSFRGEKGEEEKQDDRGEEGRRHSGQWVVDASL